MNTTDANRFTLCFRSLFQHGRDFEFPCSADGTVNLDALSQRSRINYLYARAMIGRELDFPAVELSAATSAA
jgi:hypothetical protein